MISAEQANSPENKFDLSDAEARRFSEAFRDPEFRKLFADYASEISDPKNRELYEKEILALETERGAHNPQILHTDPGICVKTRFADAGKEKVFVNLCVSKQIAEPVPEFGAKDPRTPEKRGVRWKIPYALVGSQGREDLDRSGQPALVFDCAFHPDNMARVHPPVSDGRYRDVLVQTAFDAIQARTGRKLEKKYTTPKNLFYKGKQSGATILKQPPTSDQESSASSFASQPASSSALKGDSSAPNFLAELERLGQTPVEPLEKGNGARKQPMIEELEDDENSKPQEPENTTPVEPTYKIVNRGKFNWGHYTEARIRDEIMGRPEELVFTVDLPLVESSSAVKLDVTERRLSLSVPNVYQLDRRLPYPVNHEEGKAKFDKSLRQLEIVLPVSPAPRAEMAAASSDNDRRPEQEDVEQGDIASDVSRLTEE